MRFLKLFIGPLKPASLDELYSFFFNKNREKGLIKESECPFDVLIYSNDDLGDGTEKKIMFAVVAFAKRAKSASSVIAGVVPFRMFVVGQTPVAYTDEAFSRNYLISGTLTNSLVRIRSRRME